MSSRTEMDQLVARVTSANDTIRNIFRIHPGIRISSFQVELIYYERGIGLESLSAWVAAWVAQIRGWELGRLPKKS